MHSSFDVGLNYQIASALFWPINLMGAIVCAYLVHEYIGYLAEGDDDDDDTPRTT